MQEQFLDWKHTLPQSMFLSSSYLSVQTKSYLETALAFLDQDADVVHQVVRELASERVLAFIRSTVESAVVEIEPTASFKLWEEQICLLFQIISHPGVVDSAILEQEVANIYRVLLGVDGTRLQSIFNFILGLVRGWSAISATNESSEMQVLAVSCGILIKAIDSSTSNIVNPRFQSIVTEIDHFRESCAAPDNKFYSMQTSKYLDYARRRLGIGQSLPSPTDRAPQSSSRACFSLGQELPGALSRRGQRHDNDHEDICDIKLMPTFEEIMSARDEYLPGIDASQHHVQGIQGLLDRQFRLLREDSFYDLRNAIRADLDTLAGRSAVMEPSRLRTKVVAYDRPTATDILFNRQNGLELVIKFGQPRNIRKSNRAERSAWWTRTKRLNPGSFVCLLDEVNNVLFFLVSMSTEVVSKEKSLQQPGNSKGGHKGTEDGDEKQSFTLADDSDHAYVHLQLADPTTDEVKQCLRWYKSMGSRQARRMLEFPGILMPSVLPPLKALQAMSRKMDIPFQHLLVPSQSNPSPKNEPPLYAMKAGFTFDLSSLSNDGTELTYSPTETPDPMSLSRHSTLDYTQAEAILNSLRRSMALTQGPPGTGKSYTGEALIKVLLANKKAANLGPIVCVCYTNHALDQLLEHLVDGGVTQIVRIGSRSKSDRLADVNLRVVARGQTRTRTEGRVLFESREELDSETRFLTGRLSAFKYTKTDEKIRDWLNGHHPRIARDIFGTFSDNDDGWKTVEKPKQKILQKWLESGPHSDAEPRPLNLLYQLDTSTLCRQDRLTLYQDWLQKALASTLGSVAASHTSYSELRDHDLRLKQEIDLRCLQEANIIGVTTTGLARQLELLRKVHAKVLVCEEAGEVLEGHLLTALLPTVEHAILIGDHLQLRPQIQDWRLQRANPAGEKYSLDVSLFERLVSPRHDGGSTLSRSILNTQRRMHPSISELIRSTLYPALVDSANVQEYPEIPGMGKRLFWLHHEVPEAGRNGQDSVDTSYSNDYEVKMVSALVSHLLRQGTYRAGDIAVLTPYLGQLSKLRQSLGATFQIVLNDRDAENLAETGDDPASPAATAATTTGVLSPVAKSNSLQEVRAATVDNFQGEEAKVVIVSLVRSNNEKKCGFLSTSNRINVLLSRAQHGMYIIGNVETSSHVPMWAKVVNLLQQGDNIGPKLELQSPCDWVPCSRRCEKTLDCGHQCPSLCGEDCPDKKFCQHCASEDVKSIVVDLFEMKEYKDIDLDKEPCIFPDCGHPLTYPNMDGQMSLRDHYTLSPDDVPIAILAPSQPFGNTDGGDIKVCPQCRGSLRNIARYGRVVRRGLLDESTKKFITWSNNQFKKLFDKFADAEGELLRADTMVLENSDSGMPDLTASRVEQISGICKATTLSRYKSLKSVRIRTATHMSKLGKDEQPYQRVANVVNFVSKKRHGVDEFAFDDKGIQMGGYLQTMALLLRCDLLILSDFVSLCRREILLHPEFRKRDVSCYVKDCQKLIDLAKGRELPRQQVEGHIFMARFCALSPLPETKDSATDSTEKDLREVGKKQLELAKDLLDRFKSTEPLTPEYEAALLALNGGVFYSDVSAAEKKAVYLAMSAEFRGTGHWYTCERGHPFTIGECGMPMQLARCPECDAPVGGQSHQAAAGVSSATEFEALGRSMGGMRL
ncbi:hypothetical protein ACHAQA_007950 [Verticillium albo-atrum]